MNQFVVDTAALRTHAAEVAQVASGLQTALQAVSHTSMSGNAFGMICSFFLAPATVLQSSGVAGMSSATKALNGAAAAMTAAAETYDAVDDATSGRLTTLLRELR